MMVPYKHNASCTLSLRKPEIMRQRECRWKHSLRTLSCNLWCSCLALLDLAFLVVHDAQVKESRASPSCRLVSRAKIRYTLGHTLVFIFDRFFSIRIPGYFQEFGKRYAQVSIHSGRCVIFKKTPIHQNTRLILALVCTPLPCSRSSWIDSSRQESRKSHLHSLVLCNSRSQILPNALSESVLPVLSGL